MSQVYFFFVSVKQRFVFRSNRFFRHTLSYKFQIFICKRSSSLFSRKSITYNWIPVGIFDNSIKFCNILILVVLIIPVFRKIYVALWSLNVLSVFITPEWRDTRSVLFQTGSIRVFVVSVVRVASWIVLVRSYFSMISLMGYKREFSKKSTLK